MTFQRKPDVVTTQSHLNALILQNTKLARRCWEITTEQTTVLRTLTREFELSVALGDLTLIDNKWYVTNAGLLRLAERRRCLGIRVEQVREFCDPAAGRWVFKATLYKRRGAQAFVGFGDADPANVSYLLRGAEMRIAETRAVNRALRKAYGIGLCSMEELGSHPGSFGPTRESKSVEKRPSENGSTDGQPRLRDKLCLLIREHKLDPNLVKAYAADFCGTQALRDANRDQIEAFVSRLSNEAKENRDGLVCKLNSYTQSQEVKS